MIPKPSVPLNEFDAIEQELLSHQKRFKVRSMSVHDCLEAISDLESRAVQLSVTADGNHRASRETGGLAFGSRQSSILDNTQRLTELLDKIRQEKVSLNLYLQKLIENSRLRQEYYRGLRSEQSSTTTERRTLSVEEFMSRYGTIFGKEWDLE